jgi:hypothetical protein
LGSGRRKGFLLGASQPQGKNTTVLPNITLEELGPTLAVEGATDSEDFEAYVERLLASTLRRGQVVVMDNLTVH